MTEQSSAVTEPRPGEVFDGRYEILEVLGEGGVGVVYRARRLKLELPVAIKLLRHQSAADREIRLRFEREARALAGLAHPNIVSVTDFGVWEGRPYLVMEWLDGQTLRARLKEGRLAADALLQIMTQLARGLAYAHAAGLVHRDLKPENVFLQHLPDQPPHVKVLDFGFAKLADEQLPEHVRDLTRTGVIFGTPAYMSPEQTMGEHMDARTDVYAAGVIMFEALAGKRPFEGEFVEIRRAKLSGPAPELASVNPDADVSPELLAVIRRALSRDREARHADAGELLEALLAIPRASMRPPARRTLLSSLRALPSLPSPRPERVAVPALVVMAAGVALLVWIALGRAPSPGASNGAATPRADASERPDAEGGPGPALVRHETAEDMVISLDDVPEPPPADAPRPAAENPWQRGGIPARMRVAKRRAVAGEELSPVLLSSVKQYAHDHRDDPRPSLILAYVYANRGWLTDAIERYRLAYRIDPRARGDRRMLEDLVQFVAISDVAPRTERAIEEIYGDEAVAHVDHVLKRGRLQRDDRRRLQALRARLAD